MLTPPTVSRTSLKFLSLLFGEKATVKGHLQLNVASNVVHFTWEHTRFKVQSDTAFSICPSIIAYFPEIAGSVITTTSGTSSCPFCRPSFSDRQEGSQVSDRTTFTPSAGARRVRLPCVLLACCDVQQNQLGGWKTAYHDMPSVMAYATLVFIKCFTTSPRNSNSSEISPPYPRQKRRIQ